MKKLTKDIIERTIWTAISAFLAVWTVGGVAELKSAGVAAAAAVLSVIKGIAATKVGDPESAATLKN